MAFSKETRASGYLRSEISIRPLNIKAEGSFAPAESNSSVGTDASLTRPRFSSVSAKAILTQLSFGLDDLSD